MTKPANDNKHLSDDDLLYRCVEQLCTIANVAKVFSEMQQVPLTPEGQKKSAEAIADLHEMTRGLNTNPILSRLLVNIAAGSNQKHMIAATLSVSKKDKRITMRMHYGPGNNDYSDMLVSPEVAAQLSEGLMRGLDMITPKQSIILPESKLIQ